MNIQGTYIQKAAITFVIAIIFYFVRFHHFAWGNTAVLSNGATFNDIWYYNLSVYFEACFACSFACLTIWIADLYCTSLWVWLFKYISIEIAVIMSLRGMFHTLTYVVVGDIEVMLNIACAGYVVYRAICWYLKHIKHDTSRYTLENN